MISADTSWERSNPSVAWLAKKFKIPCFTRLSRRGRRALKGGAMQAWRQVENQVLANLTPEEKILFRPLLLQVLVNLTK
jgi:hypothetical protein